MSAFPPLELWTFQQEDLERMRTQDSVLAAWEMGTGKTRFGIARDRELRTLDDLNGRTLVIAPLATLEQWQRAFEEFTPLTVAVIDPKNRHRFLQQRAHVFIMHWEALRLMPSLKDVQWQHIIADEVHKAKNRKTKQTIALKRLPTRYKTGLSGTPATGRPQDLWSILNWLYPKRFKSYWKFVDEYVLWEVDFKAGQSYRKFKGPNPATIGHLHELIEDYYSRHLKKSHCCVHHPNGVMPWLPDKYYTKVFVELHPQQRRAYEQMRKEMLAWVGEHEDQPIAAPVAISQLVRLQQFALGYVEIVDGVTVMTEPSAKLDALMQILEDNPEEQVVVYSQWKAPLRMCAARFAKAGITYTTYTGDDSKSERRENKEAFINGSKRVLLGTVGAGGVGVDGLQSASNIIVFLDRMWSPADNIQAEDRLWRGGQEKAVQIIDLIAINTVDLGRMQRIEEKWSWIKQILGDDTYQLQKDNSDGS